MDMAVKWVFQAVSVHGRPVEAGQKPCLCFKGRKYMLAIGAAYPLRVFKRPVTDFTRLRDVRRADGSVHAVSDAARTLRGMVKAHGITQGAERLLAYAEEVTAGAQAPVVDDESFNDEENLVMSARNETPAQETVPGGQAETDANNTAAEGGEKETTVTKKKPAAKAKTTTKKPAAKAPVKSPVKAKTTTKKPAAKAPAKAKVVGDTPFRPGTAKESAFKEYKAKRKTYDALERGGKREWCDALAKKLGIGSGTISSWINGQFRKALDA